MERPTTRVLAVLELLQSHGRISGPALANRIGVDGRTLRRYIAMLEELGIPITTERGRHGGYLLVAGFKLPPMMFTEDEALALSVGLLAARGLGLADAAPAVASAQAKLERVMPAALKLRLRAVDESVALELPRSNPRIEDNAALLTLSSAAQQHLRVRLRYRTPSELSERELDPYGLAWRAGRWYAVGHCHLRQGLRSFRLDRVEQVRATTMVFQRPQGFDTLAHMRWSMAALPRRYAVTVLLQTDLATARREVFSAFGLLEPQGQGVLLTAQADDLDWFARELARLPFDFVVRTPSELRAAVAGRGLQLQRLAREGNWTQ